jgi:hypothetical protein
MLLAHRHCAPWGQWRGNVTDQGVWIDNVQKIAPGEVHLPIPTQASAISPKISERLKEGDVMSFFALSVWTFASGDSNQIEALTRAFSVYVQTEGGTISHGLSTALIDKNGKIDEIWRGNAWKPEEVIEAIRAMQPRDDE